MKKAFFVSLVLMSLFLTGSVAESGIGDCQDYLCNSGYVMCGGETVGTFTGEEECLVLCFEDGVAHLTGPDFIGELGLIGTKDMVGICDIDMELMGCSARTLGSTLELNLFADEGMFSGCIIHARCVTCDGCCK